MFEIYNLVSIIQNDRPELGIMKKRIGLHNIELSKNFKETFMSERGNTGNAMRQGEDVYHDRQVVDALLRQGTP
jgi:hypothetical protein